MSCVKFECFAGWEETFFRDSSIETAVTKAVKNISISKKKKKQWLKLKIKLPPTRTMMKKVSNFIWFPQQHPIRKGVMTHHPSEFLWAGFGYWIVWTMNVGLMGFRVDKDLLLTRFCEDERMNKKHSCIQGKGLLLLLVVSVVKKKNYLWWWFNFLSNQTSESLVIGFGFYRGDPCLNLWWF